MASKEEDVQMMPLDPTFGNVRMRVTYGEVTDPSGGWARNQMALADSASSADIFSWMSVSCLYYHESARLG